MRSRTLAAVGTALIFLIGLTGCTASSGGGDLAEEKYEISRIKDYSNLAELEAESDLIVTVTVTEEFEAFELNGLPFTRRVVLPTEVHKGEAPERLTVNGIGTPAAEGALEPGTVHLMFLRAFELEPGVPTGDYVVTGVFAGDFVEAPSGEFIRLDEESPSLPEQIVPEELSEILG